MEYEVRHAAAHSRKPGPSLLVAKNNKVLAHDRDRDRIALDLARQGDRLPVAAQKLTHGRIGTGFDQFRVIAGFLAAIAGTGGDRPLGQLAGVNLGSVHQFLQTKPDFEAK